jgi:hypothetical protein
VRAFDAMVRMESHRAFDAQGAIGLLGANSPLARAGSASGLSDQLSGKGEADRQARSVLCVDTFRTGVCLCSEPSTASIHVPRGEVIGRREERHVRVGQRPVRVGRLVRCGPFHVKQTALGGRANIS